MSRGAPQHLQQIHQQEQIAIQTVFFCIYKRPMLPDPTPCALLCTPQMPPSLRGTQAFILTPLTRQSGRKWGRRHGDLTAEHIQRAQLREIIISKMVTIRQKAQAECTFLTAGLTGCQPSS